jgi:hypothetical protein
MTKSTQFDKTGMATPYFDSAVPKGVYGGNYDSASDGRTTPAGGEVRRSEVLERGGSMLRPSLAGDSSVRR